jgi:hypothetical protein
VQSRIDDLLDDQIGNLLLEAWNAYILGQAELRHLLDLACLSFLGMLLTFTGFSHGVNQSSERKKASLLPALFPLVLLNFEAQAKCNHDERERNTMSNSACDDNNRPTLTSVEAQPHTDTAIAAFVSELQQGWDQRDAPALFLGLVRGSPALSNKRFRQRLRQSEQMEDRLQ